MSNNSESLPSGNAETETTEVVIDGQVFIRTVLPAAVRTRRGQLSQRGAVPPSRRTSAVSAEESAWLAERDQENLDALRSIHRARETGHVYPGATPPPTTEINGDYGDHISE